MKRMERANRIARITFAFVLSGALLPAISIAQSAATPASIPSDGGTVKSGDVIVWKVNKTITLEAQSTATSGASSAAPPTALGATPTAADVAAAAKALSKAAHDVLTAAGPAPATSDSGAAAFNAAAAAARQADLEMTQDFAAAYAAGPGVVATHDGTVQATANLVKAAAKNLSSASGTAAVMQAQDYLAAATNALASASTTPTTATPTPASAQATACFPANSRFNVTKVVAATKSSTENTSTGAAPSNTQLVTGHFSSNWAASLFHPWHFDALPAASQPCGAGVPEAKYDVSYDFTGDQLSKQDFYRQGFTWGGLVIPYKYYFADRSIKSNASVVAYAGYQGWFPGVSVSTVVAMGAGTAPISTASPNSGSTPSTASSTSSTAVTYTAALGFIFAFGDQQTLKAGLMFGRDYQSNPSVFPYENKTWMALSIGAGF